MRCDAADDVAPFMSCDARRDCCDVVTKASEVVVMTDDPEGLRTYAAIFDKMIPSDATLAAAKALRFQADEIERRQSGIEVADTAGRCGTAGT
jgi:hypothetical protein